MGMKVLFLITGLSFGGAETQLVRLATRLKERGWEVKVVTLLSPKAYVEELEEAGISVFSLDIKSKMPNPRPLWHLVRLICKWRPRIVHSHMIHANIFARIAQIFAPVPVLISSARNIDERGRKGSGRLRTFLYRITDPLCDLTTQVSRVGLERYIQIGAVSRYKIRYIPNGVDTERFHPDLEIRARVRKVFGFDNDFVWIAVGRFDPQKNYASLFQAFTQVLKRRPDARLLIAGDGPLRPSMEVLAEELGIAERVSFLGIRRDVPELMNASDAYVMSSAWEGMPNVLLEAHATGLPIVATDVGGNGEIVLDGVTGFLVPPGEPDSLAQAMMRLMNLPPEEQSRMGELGRQHIVENFDMERVVDKWEELY
ncbi:glycosyltransferase [Thermatribacter velox]|uniref:Glycosyltransferase n=1 Tax=Thermatribacter velox TaxID=3039681 RepID=A0ABZ2YA32_9BACT